MVSTLSTGSFSSNRLAGSRVALGLCFLLGFGAGFIGWPQEGLATVASLAASADTVPDTTNRKRIRIAAKANKRRNTAQSRSRYKTLNGPLQIVVSLSNQRVNVYKAGKRIASSKISTGQRGYRTPTGIFTVLQKKRRHYSNIYRGAPMPYMQRITWSGIALHAGYVPNYPASHGCIRLPRYFARKLYRQTRIGDHVIVGREMGVPEKIQHANLFQPTSVASLSHPGLLYSSDEQMPLSRSSIQFVQMNQIRHDSTRLPTLKVVHRNGFSSPKSENTNLLSSDWIRQASIKLMDIETDIFRRQLISKRNKRPLRILLTRRTGRERIEDVQRMLNQLGFDSGIPDGILGKKTVAAVKEFQAARGLEIDGVLSDTIIEKIGLAAGRDLTSNGYIYIRQNFKDILGAPVKIKNTSGPLGTHLFTADGQEGSERVHWMAITIKERSAKAGAASEALGKVDLPGYVKTFISDRLTPGSSLIISDNGISHETGKYTDFIVLTR